MFYRFGPVLIFTILLFLSPAYAVAPDRQERESIPQVQAGGVGSPDEIIVAQRFRSRSYNPRANSYTQKRLLEQRRLVERQRIQKRRLREERMARLREQRRVRQEKLRQVRAEQRQLREQHLQKLKIQQTQLREKKLRDQQAQEQEEGRNVGVVAALGAKPSAIPKHLHERLTTVSRLALQLST